jgi:hypothetical protein
VTIPLRSRPCPPPTDLRRASAPLALLLATALMSISSAPSAVATGLIVVPRPASGPALSYFKLLLRPGGRGQAGAVELRNPTAQPIKVVLDPVDGQTLDTLGSAYAPPGSAARGAARWLRVGARAVTIAPRRTVVVPIAVAVPAGATPGDYLGGISVEALHQHASSTTRRGVSIASVERYAIGVEVSLPGPRHPAIRFTGAALQRQPAGLIFLLHARNTGNVILQGVHGSVRIARAGHTVVSAPIEAGTFVTNTAISYPVPAFGQTPAQGTLYEVSAWLRYPGGIARMSTTVAFGHREAVIQEQYGGPRAQRAGGAWWKIAGPGGAALLLGGLLGGAFLLRSRRARPLTLLSGVAMLERGLAGTVDDAHPCSAILVKTMGPDFPSATLVCRGLRPRLRQGDRLCDLGDGRWMIVLPDTGPRAAAAIREDLGEFLARDPGLAVHAPSATCATAERPIGVSEMLDRLDGDPDLQLRVGAATRVN